MWIDGVVTTDDGQVIARPGMTPDELRSSPAAAHATVLTDQPTWFRIWMRPITIDGHRCGAIAIFVNGQIAEFYFGMTDDEAMARLGKRPNLLDQAWLHRSWLSQATGRKGKVKAKWGSVDVVLDNKLKEVCITLSYS